MTTQEIEYLKHNINNPSAIINLTAEMLKKKLIHGEIGTYEIITYLEDIKEQIEIISKHLKELR